MTFNYYFSPQIKIAPKRKLKDIFDDGNNIKELTDPVEEQVEQKPYAMPEDIEKGKLPPEEILSLPMFKVLESLHYFVYDFCLFFLFVTKEGWLLPLHR